jgi:hypothetical protein
MSRFNPVISATVFVSATTLAFPRVDDGDIFGDSRYSSDRSEISMQAEAKPRFPVFLPTSAPETAFGRNLSNLAIAGPLLGVDTTLRRNQLIDAAVIKSFRLVGNK